VFAFVSGFLAIVPLLTSWLVWLPATLILIARDGVFSGGWVIMSGLHLAAWMSTSAFYNWAGRHDDRPQVLGYGFAVCVLVVLSLFRSCMCVVFRILCVFSMSIVLGLYAFGPYGAIWGPILYASLMALLMFYKEATGSRIHQDTAEPALIATQASRGATATRGTRDEKRGSTVEDDAGTVRPSASGTGAAAAGVVSPLAVTQSDQSFATSPTGVSIVSGFLNSAKPTPSPSQPLQSPPTPLDRYEMKCFLKLYLRVRSISHAH